ncbi:hypothetical protein I4U23_023778 [Adineta vaga]|nr:hypothetical protein I4U23_023778 [Adineta vaga]
MYRLLLLFSLFLSLLIFQLFITADSYRMCVRMPMCHGSTSPCTIGTVCWEQPFPQPALTEKRRDLV